MTTPKQRRPPRLCRTVEEIRAAAVEDAAQHDDLTDAEIAKVLGLLAPYREQLTRRTRAA